jgi:glyceraldehyde-3-phosphate dehydrogenase (NADP+)
MRLLVAGRETGAGRPLDVRNPYDGSLIDTVPEATPGEIADALSAAARGARAMAAMTRFERGSILDRTSALLAARSEDLARLLASEVGKTIREARSEVARAARTFAFAADEARRLSGEEVPFDASPHGRDRFGFWVRVPVGVVVAVTPFNFPLNLAAHKVAPAIAAGNAVVLKPATATPLTDLRLGSILYEAGLPGDALSVLTGSGGAVGDALVSHALPRMVTFTGSADVGRSIAARAGLKKLAMELGSNSAVIVTDRCDVEDAAERCVRGAYAVAGQVCISVQRVLVQKSVERTFVDAAIARATALAVGDQLLEGTDVGPMIDEGEAARAVEWIGEAVRLGGRLAAGGERSGATVTPAVIVDAPEEARLWKDEAFAPVMAVRSYDDLGEAIAGVNRSRYGLQAGIFTDSIDDALRAVREIECGGVMVNDTPAYRVDQMPYGGMKESGIGREGPRFAVEEMTEIRVVGFRR